MIKFFRHIRKKLIDQSRIRKYLVYAFGEVILVVIGILIALQINNWNEQNKLKVEEKKLISALVKEIENNIELLTSSIKTNQSILQGSNDFIKKAAISYNFEFEASDIPQLFAYSSIKTEYSILNEILGTDSRALISNQTYIQKLRTLKQSYIRNEKTQFYVDEYWNNQITVLLNNLGLGIYMTANDVFDAKKIDFKITDSFLSSLSLMNGFQKSFLMSREDLLRDLKTTLKTLKNVDHD